MDVLKSPPLTKRLSLCYETHVDAPAVLGKASKSCQLGVSLSWRGVMAKEIASGKCGAICEWNSYFAQVVIGRCGFR